MSLSIFLGVVIVYMIWGGFKISHTISKYMDFPPQNEEERKELRKAVIIAIIIIVILLIMVSYYGALVLRAKANV